MRLAHFPQIETFWSPRSKFRAPRFLPSIRLSNKRITLYCTIQFSLRCSIQWHSSTTCTRQQGTHVVVTVWLCIHVYTPTQSLTTWHSVFTLIHWHSTVHTGYCISSISCHGYLFCCSFCAVTIRGRCLFLWKAWRHQWQLDKVRTSMMVTVARHCQ